MEMFKIVRAMLESKTFLECKATSAMLFSALISFAVSEKDIEYLWWWYRDQHFEEVFINLDHRHDMCRKMFIARTIRT